MNISDHMTDNGQLINLSLIASWVTPALWSARPLCLCKTIYYFCGQYWARERPVTAFSRLSRSPITHDSHSSWSPSSIYTEPASARISNTTIHQSRKGSVPVQEGNFLVLRLEHQTVQRWTNSHQTLNKFRKKLLNAQFNTGLLIKMSSSSDSRSIFCSVSITSAMYYLWI